MSFTRITIDIAEGDITWKNERGNPSKGKGNLDITCASIEVGRGGEKYEG